MVIPKDTRDSLGFDSVSADEWAGKFPDANPALLFTRFLPLWNGQVIRNEKRQALSSLAKRPFKCEPFIHSRQKDRLASLKERGFEIVEREVRQATPFVSRLGESHPFENGFFFHPLYGVPFLPGSGVKGAVRAAVAEELRKPLFGNEKKNETSEHRSRAVFFDAFPEGDFHLRVDIMTPHHTKYLEGNSSATDTQNPVPVPILVVASGAKWVFRVAVGPPEEGLAGEVAAALDHVLEWHGLGAKKSSGYGSFVTS